MMLSAITTQRGPVLVVAGLAVLLGLGICATGYIYRQQTEALRQATVRARLLQKEVSDARNGEVQATLQAKACGDLAAKWQRVAQDARAKLASLPPDPGPKPVGANLPSSAVLSELHSMGVSPEPLESLGKPLVLGLTLPDGRTVLGWGREAQRVGPLVGRLDACIALAQAQEGQTNALLIQVSDLSLALESCDSRAEAQERRASELEVAIAAQDKAAKAKNWNTRLKWGGVTVGALGLGYLIGGLR